MNKIESFNGGTILKIYTSETNYFYYDVIAQVNINTGNSRLNSLSPDQFTINCATICEPAIVPCDESSLLSNNNSCLLANDNSFLIHN
jgi:hypothetical protein